MLCQPFVMLGDCLVFGARARISLANSSLTNLPRVLAAILRAWTIEWFSVQTRKGEPARFPSCTARLVCRDSQKGGAIVAGFRC